MEKIIHDKVDGKTMEEWIAEETAERETTFWGQPCTIKPVIHSEVFGDGLQLCYLGTIDQRPNYWLIRIDSSIDVESPDFDFEEILLCPLEEEFGRCEEYLSEEEFNEAQKDSFSEAYKYDDYADYSSWLEYPHVSWSGGHWGTVVNFVEKLEYNKDLFS